MRISPIGCSYTVRKTAQPAKTVPNQNFQGKHSGAKWGAAIFGTAATLVCAYVIPFCLYKILQLPAEKYASNVERGEIDPGNDRAESVAQYLTAAISHGVYLFRGCPLYLGMASVCAAISNTMKLLWNYFK
jgi:hypothetical protein